MSINTLSSDKIMIEVMKNGPLIVRGRTSLGSTDGRTFHVSDVVALCRCGASKKKPFCDGSHARIKFSAAREKSGPLDGEKKYSGKEITIYDNRAICSHAAECVGKLPQVFRQTERPWVNPDGAARAEIIALIERCPSGALHYAVDGERKPLPRRSPGITIEPGGPYYVSGLCLAGDLQPPDPSRFALCRCGASKNKPFCDGAHHDVEFDQPINPKE